MKDQKFTLDLTYPYIAALGTLSLNLVVPVWVWAVNASVGFIWVVLVLMLFGLLIQCVAVVDIYTNNVRVTTHRSNKNSDRASTFDRLRNGLLFTLLTAVLTKANGYHEIANFSTFVALCATTVLVSAYIARQKAKNRN